MLELRLSIISINPAPNKSRSERGRFMGWLVVRSFAHHATMVTLVTGPDDHHSRRRVRQAAIWDVLSTAVGSSRESLARSSSCDSPVCCSSCVNTSTPIACFISCPERYLFSP